MDKKILLSGVAALLMTGGMFATSASAAITFSHSGEAELTATFNDACTDSDLDTSDSSNATVAADHATDTTHSSCASGDSEAVPVWATDASLDWKAGGTLANGLGISVGKNGGPGVAIGLSGAFGEVSWEEGGDSAVKAALPNSDGDLDTASRDGLGGHSLSTDGTAGYVINYKAPSIGGMDLYVSYAPGDSDLNDATYENTLAIGATMTAGDITIGAGWETATENTNAATANSTGCDENGFAAGSLAAIASAEQNGGYCGDQTLMGIGVSMDVAEMGLNAGYTVLDTEDGDKTTYNIGLSTSVGAYSLGLDYVNSELAYADASSHTQTVIGAKISTDLGDGVALSLDFTNSSVDVAETGAHSNYNAVAKLTIGY